MLLFFVAMCKKPLNLFLRRCQKSVVQDSRFGMVKLVRNGFAVFFERQRIELGHHRSAISGSRAASNVYPYVYATHYAAIEELVAEHARDDERVWNMGEMGCTTDKDVTDAQFVIGS